MKNYIQGEKVDFTIQLLVKDAQGVMRPFPLTGKTDVKISWKASSSLVQKTLTDDPTQVQVLGADVDGKLKGTLLPADTAAQPKLTNGLIQIDVVFAPDNIRKFQVKGAFAVAESA